MWQYCATRSGVKKGNSMTSTPRSRSRAWKSARAPDCVNTMVGPPDDTSHRLASCAPGAGYSMELGVIEAFETLGLSV